MKQQKQAPPSTICCKQQTHIKKYTCGSRIGSGGFANVYRIESHDSHRIYACKVINKSMLKRREHQSKLISEIKIHSSLQHKHIVKFDRYFEDKQNVYILLELCGHNSMMELIQTRQHLTEYEVRYFMKQLIVALKYLHSKSVIHRDLKLGNILIDADINIKVCDFGLATRFDGERKTTICGTPNYIAPEVLNQRKWQQGHSYEVDIWSLGVIMFTLLTGKPPFETRNIEETYRRINKTRYHWPINRDETISRYAKDLVAKILNIDPRKRPNLSQLETHPFFTQMHTPKNLPQSILKQKPTENELCVNIDDCKTYETQAQHMNTEPFKNNMNRINEYNTNNNINDNNNKEIQRSQKKKIAMNDDNFIFVVRFCDYSKKYGIGYILSNGVTGIYFNDATKMLLHRDKQSVAYIDDEDEFISCSLKSFPANLAKKIKLLLHFTEYLWNKSNQNNTDLMKIKRNLAENHMNNNENECEVFVRKWLKEKYATLFRLTEKTVQVNFIDNSKLVYQDSTFVLYENKMGEKNVYALDEIYASTQRDLKKRFRYTQQLLKKLETNK